jgi:hypothetical protein
MCAGIGHLLRVGPFIIARRYNYVIAAARSRARRRRRLSGIDRYRARPDRPAIHSTQGRLEERRPFGV